MSKVEQYSRPWVTFNPTDKKHREIFHTALKHNTWGKSPVRFWLEGETSSLMDQCTQKMARYYMGLMLLINIDMFLQHNTLTVDTGTKRCYNIA